MARDGEAVGTVLETRDGDHSSLVLLQVLTGRPQDSAVEIVASERVAVEFPHDASGPLGMPMVRPLRVDFPVTGHQHISLPDRPPALCIDERPWSEARLAWGPPELLGRILNWFRRAAMGELHDASQPIDPNLVTSGLRVLISRRLLERTAGEPLIGMKKGGGDDLAIISIGDIPKEGVLGGAFSPLVLVVPPEAMTRMRFAPRTLEELSTFLSERGVDLPAKLAEAFVAALDAQPSYRKMLVEGRLIAVVQMPITSGRQANTQTIAFLADRSLGEIAIDLGVAHACEPDPKEPARLNVARAIGAAPSDATAVAGVALLPTDVHLTMDRIAAARFAGTAGEDARRVVIVGAGAIGSHLATGLAREGRYRWTVIDPDVVLPHNVARHIAGHGAVFQNKAEVLAVWLADILDDPDVAEALPYDVTNCGAARDEIDAALGDADLIIDATASLTVARYLSDHPCSARRVSAFFNSIGTAAVVLAEPTDRSVTLRDLEAQFLRDIAEVPALEGHYATEPERIAYSGGCGAITSVMPQSRVTVLSGLAAMGIGQIVDSSDGDIRAWSIRPDGTVDCHVRVPVAADVVEIDGWTISLDADVPKEMMALRGQVLPSETGGVLPGMVDIPAKRLYVLRAAAPPSDSVHSPTGFVRGTDGVEAYLEHVRDRTMGQLRYLGEWHSHPSGISVRPSSVDLRQLDWLSATLGMEELPGLMLIAGERIITVTFGPNEATTAWRADAPCGKAA